MEKMMNITREESCYITLRGKYVATVKRDEENTSLFIHLENASASEILVHIIPAIADLAIASRTLVENLYYECLNKNDIHATDGKRLHLYIVK